MESTTPPPKDTQPQPDPAQSKTPEIMVTGITTISTHESAARGLVFGIISLILFVIGFLIGFVTIAGIAFGIMAIVSAQTGHDSSAAKVLGIIGTVLNTGLLLLSLAL